MARITRELKILHLGSRLLLTVAPVTASEAKDKVRILVEIKEVIEKRIREEMRGRSTFIKNLEDRKDV